MILTKTFTTATVVNPTKKDGTPWSANAPAKMRVDGDQQITVWLPKPDQPAARAKAIESTLAEFSSGSVQVRVVGNVRMTKDAKGVDTPVMRADGKGFVVDLDLTYMPRVEGADLSTLGSHQLVAPAAPAAEPALPS